MKNRTGQRFGRLVAVAPTNSRQFGSVVWLCRCDCGAEIRVSGHYLVKGESRSCGCLRQELSTARAYKHGHGGRNKAHGESPTYSSWAAMRRRCTDPKFISYPNYGARGIRVCERWQDFGAFLADMGERPDGYELSRLDHDDDYRPGNVRWELKAENRREMQERRRAA